MTRAQSTPRVATGARRALIGAAGWLCFALGVVGLVIPGLPTTIFWIVAAWLWMRSHPERLERLLSNPRCGPSIRRFLERGEMSRRDKRAAMAGMAVAWTIWALLVQPGVLGGVAFALLLLAVATWIWWRPEGAAAPPSGASVRPPGLP